MRFAASRQTWLVTVPIALGASAYVWFVFLPGKRAIAELNGELETKQMFAASAGRTAAAIRQLETLSQDTQAYATEHRLPSASSADMARLYGAIAEAMREAGVRTTRFAPEPAVKYDQMQRTPVRVGCVGSFDEVSALLSQLEQLPYRVWIESVTMQPEREDGKAVRCEATLGIFVDNSVSSN
jgi:Tfp pilus assembly protein PilO